MVLSGKNALVTGAAHRLGKEIALQLANEGCNIAAHYNSAADKAQETLAELRRFPIKAQIFRADLRNLEEIGEMFRSIAVVFPRLDILVNSAAVMQRVSFNEVGEEDWHTTMDLNLRAPFFCIQSAVRLMSEEGGAIINISDIAGLQPWVDYPVHSLSKTGIEMLTRLAALEFAPRVRVNGVAPGPVLKPDRLSHQRWDEIGQELPIGRAGEPRNVGDAIIFLLQNDFITGETLVVDGGNQLV